ncbi:MAG: ABC transporter substrate-binding protein [Myxococcaceae bacterium]
MAGRGVVVALGLLFSGCSLTVGQGFNECAKDSDCGAGGERACLESFCVAKPEGCTESFGAVDSPGRIALAAALPLTLEGATDESEKQGLNALTLALDEVNQRDGVGGRPFALYLCDTTGDNDRLKAQATWLAEQLKVAAIITSWSGQTLAAATVTVPRDVLIMTATSTSPELSSLPDTHSGSMGLVWRTAPSDAIQGRVIAELLLNDPAFTGVARVGVVYLDDPYGQGLQQVLADRYGAAAGKFLKTIPYARGGDLGKAVGDLAAFDPDVTVLIAFPDDAVPILAAAQAFPVLTKAQNHRWFFTDSAKDPALLASATAAQISSAYGTQPAQGAGQASQSFRDRFQAKYSIDPLNFSFTSNSYDAMYVLAMGAAHAVGADGNGPVTGPTLALGLTKLSAGTSYKLTPDQLTPAKAALQGGTSIDIEGASGKLNFDSSTGEAPSPIDLWQVTAAGTGFATVRTIEPP